MLYTILDDKEPPTTTQAAILALSLNLHEAKMKRSFHPLLHFIRLSGLIFHIQILSTDQLRRFLLSKNKKNNKNAIT